MDAEDRAANSADRSPLLYHRLGMTTDATLPILQRRDEIERAIRTHQVVVICGETGSGKTTQLPQICLDLGLASDGLIGHTQPRRLAARAVAARIAEERGTRLGSLVGVKVRFNDQTSHATRVKLMTDGILLAELSADPSLSAYSAIIIDEAHERSLNIDIILAHLRTILPRRGDLKIVLTSATIDPRKFSEFFGGSAVAPVIEVSGRTYPVEIRYEPMAGDDEPDRINYEAIADAAEELSLGASGEGDTLVFLPGEREIRLAADALRRRRTDAEILPLFSRLSNAEQDRIFHPGGRRRVILATNVAETSLTVPGIRFVIDTGLARLSRYDAARKVQRLPVEPISQAAANQRSGRCGRVAAGVCIRLYSERSFQSRARFTDPEIHRANLSSVILLLKTMGFADVAKFGFLDPPDTHALRDGYETLFELGAIESPDASGRITPIGRRLARIPLDPRIARIMLAGDEQGSLREAIVLAAALSIQDPRERPAGKQEDADRAQLVFRHETSDFLTLLKIHDEFTHASEELTTGPLIAWCRDRFLSHVRLREWVDTADQLREIAEELDLTFNDRPAREDEIHRALLTGLISNVACRVAEEGSFDYRGVRGNAVQIFPGSALFRKSPKWIMAGEVVQTTRLYARTVARIDPSWIEELAGHMFRRQRTDPHFDGESGRPSAWERVTMSGIVVVPRRRIDLADHDAGAAREIFIAEGLVGGRWSSARGFMEHNSRMLEEARAAGAKLRRKDAAASESDLARWFDARLPREVCDPITLESWLDAGGADRERSLMLSPEDALSEAARLALGSDAYPDSLRLDVDGGTVECPLTYAFSPGHDTDGVTCVVPLGALASLARGRGAWLVPGMLAGLIGALIKSLPKPDRGVLERHGKPDALGASLAASVDFARGTLPAALSEACAVLHGVTIDPSSWPLTAVPTHFRFRVRVVDEQGREIAVSRDPGSLAERLAPRIAAARRRDDQVANERHGLTTWDFDRLEDSIDVPREGASASLFPCLIDRGECVSLGLASSREEADLATFAGTRRLFAIASREEVGYSIDALPAWHDMQRQFQQLGSADELRDALTCLVADRAFLANQPAIRTRSAFEERRDSNWGRLSSVGREVGELVARILEPRSRVAQRISGGTPRLWAESVADIREQAAYLMPRGFLLLAPYERLRRYPSFVELMRQRLFSLREDGSKVETDSLKRFSPHWKRFTGWVASAMSARRAAQSEIVGDPTASSARSGGASAVDARPSGTGAIRSSKAPLPAPRKTAPVVNVDAGEWAMIPGNLPPAVERHRWALEEARLVVFGGSGADAIQRSLRDLESSWSGIGPIKAKGT